MPSNSTPKVILLRGEPPAREALVASAVVTPGMLLAMTSTGAARPHNVAAGMASPLFAREDEYEGKSIDDTIAIGSLVGIWACTSGDQIYSLVKAGAAAIVAGDYLESAGDGTFQKSTHAVTSATTAAAVPVARALEAVDNSGGGSAVRIRVEVL